MNNTIPSLFPIVRIDTGKPTLVDGDLVQACSFCKHAVANKSQCAQHYADLSNKNEGYYECPFGFTTRTLFFLGQMWAITAIVAFPRFDSLEERKRAKDYPQIKVTRIAIESFRSFLRNLEQLRADTIKGAAQVLPHAFHELRKLNGAILQHAEKEIGRIGETPSLVSIHSAAELVRNNYDILEALSNIDAMKAVPLDATINLFDLCYKTRSVLLERASIRRIFLDVRGVRAIIAGSRKSFPIVPAVLIENAIKYGRDNTTIEIVISAQGKHAILQVTNLTDFPIDPDRCFERGSRYATAVEGSGYGLFLAKEIIIAHSGSIECDRNADLVQMTVKLPLIDVIAFA